MVQKWVFRPAPPCQISRLSGRKCGNTAPKTVKIWNFGRKFVPQGWLVCNIFTKFSVFVRIQLAFKFLVWSLSRHKHPSYKHFPAVGAFSHKFSIAPSGEITDKIKKSYRVRKRDGDTGSRAGCRQKSVMFFVCLSVFLSRFGMTKFVITETLWSSIIFKTIMVSLHRGRFVVVQGSPLSPCQVWWGYWVACRL